MKRVSGVGLNDLGDPNAEPGSKEWALFVANEIRKSLYDASRSTTNLETSVNLFKQHNGWQAFGYLTWDQFCHERLQKNVEEIEVTITMRRRSQLEATAPRPLNAHGGDRYQGYNYNLDSDNRGTKLGYITARIARDRPDILERMKAGKYRSVRAAGIAAGIIDPSKTPYQVNKDPAKAGRYLAGRVDREWMEAMIESYNSHNGKDGNEQ